MTGVMSAPPGPDIWAVERRLHEQFNRERFGLTLSFDGVKVPKVRGSLDLPLFIHEHLVERFSDMVAEGLYQRIWLLNPEHTLRVGGKELDALIGYDERHPRNGSYAVLAGNYCDATSAGEKFQISADKVAAKRLCSETLIEHLYHCMFYEWRWQVRLNKKSWTICSGTRFRDGKVPCVFIAGDDFVIGEVKCQDESPTMAPRIVRELRSQPRPALVA